MRRTHRHHRSHPATQPGWPNKPQDCVADLAWVLAGGFVAIILWWITRHFPLLIDWPVTSLIVLAALGGLGGRVIQQALDQRRAAPRVLRKVQRGLQAGQWGVLFYPEDARQTEAVRTALRVRAAEFYSSLEHGHATR